MEKIYAALIQKGLKTIEDVPENLRQKTVDILQKYTKSAMIR